MINNEKDLQAQTRHAIGSKSNLPNYAKHWDCFKDKNPQITPESSRNKGLESGDWREEANRSYRRR